MTSPAQLFATLVRRASAQAHRHRRVAELDAELAFHAELVERELRSGGLSERDARDAARRRIGNHTRIKEDSWNTSSIGALESATRELRMAWRTARKSTGYSLTVILTLAMGIGATVSIFSVLDHVLLRPLAYSNADRLVALYQHGAEGNQRLVSYPTLLDWSEARAGFSAMAYVRGDGQTLLTPSGPESVGTGFVSRGFFTLMDTRPALGRTFVPDEEVQSGADAVVLSHDIWVRSFGADPHIIGRVVTLDSATPTVVGVMPPGFAYPEWAQVWRPLGQILGRDSALQHRDFHVDSRAIARLSPTTDIARASRLLSSVQGRIALTFPAIEGKWPAADVVPLKTEVVGNIGPAIWALVGAVAVILLIACVNLANLSAVRGTSRAREMAVRLALGASGGQLSLKLIVETLLLALTGAILGALGARSLVAWLRATAPFNLPRAAEISLDSRALLVAIFVTVTTALVFGVVPALRAAVPDGAVGALLGRRSSAGGTRAQARMRGLLTGAQFSLALVLLVGAGLLLQSYRRLQTVNLGFDPNGLATFSVHPPKERFADARAALDLYERLVDRMKGVPGVEDAALVNFMPPGGAGVPTRLEIPGRTVNSDDIALYVTASEGYQRTLRMRLTRGRWFSAGEMRSPGNAIVISESVAQRYWPHAEALGQSLTIFRSSQVRPDFGEAVPSIVVGIVGDLRQNGPGSDLVEAVYVPLSAEPWAWGTLVVRTRASAPASNLALALAVKEVEPALVTTKNPADEFGAVTRDLSSILAPRRYILSLLGAFSICALALAAVGIYGVTSYGVAQRTQELGIRRALGAAEREIERAVLIRGMAPALLGCAIGLALTFVIIRYVKHILADITSLDPAVLIGISALLLAVGFAACYVPARRAKRIDPMIALRAE
ncbi:MAG: ABC transporter permease [Gemmatimonadota bacterium]|nr:ABC transporter permease [Gemmatimonadota bacterium]